MLVSFAIHDNAICPSLQKVAGPSSSSHDNRVLKLTRCKRYGMYFIICCVWFKEPSESGVFTASRRILKLLRDASASKYGFAQECSIVMKRRGEICQYILRFLFKYVKSTI